MSFGNLAKMAQQMQAQMARVQAELAVLTVQGSAGGGAVTATATGKGDLISIVIDPEVVDAADVEMLQDLVTAAVNEALRAAHAETETRMAAVTGGLRLPGLG
ncbi:MAG: YbaB/EbfC family nucleoid-associated protein [Candidatus Limnocylindrales bacterium]